MPMSSASLAFARSCLVAAALTVAAGAQAQTAPAAAPAAPGANAAVNPVRNIDVVVTDGSYTVTAQMFAPVSQDVVWQVLTDFPNMNKWVPNLLESKVTKPGEKQFSILQRGVAKFAGLSFNYESEREIVLTPQLTILSTQTKGNMKKMQSLMTLSPEGTGTKMVYKLDVSPSFIASTVMSPDFMRHEITEQFTAIVGEMLKRKK